MKERRDDARPRLKIVNEAIQELWEYMKDYLEEQYIDDHKEYWDEILDKHDINYNDLNRWSEV